VAKYRYHRLDENHAAIRAALEREGATVVPDGPLDLLVGFRGANYLLEVKTAKGKLRASQEAFVRRWKGQVHVVRTVEDALAAIGATDLHICQQPGFDPSFHRCLGCA
jgi:hypothetical protein